MKKHIVVKAASCLDMIHAINSKIQEFDPDYVGGSEVINASEDGNSPAYYWMVKYTDVMKNVHKIAFPLDTSDFSEAEQEMDAYISEPYIKAILLGKLEGHLKDQLLNDGFKIVASCNNSCNDTDCKQTVTAEDDITRAAVDEDYIDEIMPYIADETASLDPPCSCTWRVEGDELVFVVAGIQTDTVEEYRCPLSDLTGEIEADVAYIAMSINSGDYESAVESDILQEDTTVDSSTDIVASESVHQRKIRAILDKLGAEGYDNTSDYALDYADSAAQLIASWEDTDYWFEETVKNYPEDLEPLKLR